MRSGSQTDQILAQLHGDAYAKLNNNQKLEFFQHLSSHDYLQVVSEAVRRTGIGESHFSVTEEECIPLFNTLLQRSPDMTFEGLLALIQSTDIENEFLPPLSLALTQKDAESVAEVTTMLREARRQLAASPFPVFKSDGFHARLFTPRSADVCVYALLTDFFAVLFRNATAAATAWLSARFPLASRLVSAAPDGAAVPKPGTDLFLQPMDLTVEFSPRDARVDAVHVPHVMAQYQRMCHALTVAFYTHVVPQILAILDAARSDVVAPGAAVVEERMDAPSALFGVDDPEGEGMDGTHFIIAFFDKNVSAITTPLGEAGKTFTLSSCANNTKILKVLVKDTRTLVQHTLSEIAASLMGPYAAGWAARAE
eukprot:gnl/Chilomastix_cuspidata/1887.p2 GENE.gnl/Chilomastix_cuspidata/1887~~gnl/Chilomastix_cuspidata/1887.p2  ORF type:complete len:368 (+),score=111.34 gnl/Chilomastix_cuspidata/1887:1450-2553(+)